MMHTKEGSGLRKERGTVEATTHVVRSGSKFQDVLGP